MFLAAVGRTDIPIGIGVPVGAMKNGHRQDGWVKDFDLSSYSVKIHPDGVQAMVDTVEFARSQSRSLQSGL